MTIRDIALQAGVSIGTVDRVLHNRGRVSPETKNRIESIVERSGYRPNPIARHLKLKREYQFYIFGPRADEDSGYWNIVYQGIRKAADELNAFGIRVLFAEFDRYSKDSFWSTVEKIPLNSCDGLLLAPVEPEETKKWLQSIPPQIPYAFFDATLPEATPITSIGQDPFNGGFLAGKLLALLSLMQKGTFCTISPHSEDYHINQRIKGFLSFWIQQGTGYSMEVRTCSNLDHELTRTEFLSALLREIPHPRGIFVANAAAHWVAEFVNSGKETHIPIIGYDLVPENVRLLREGCIDVLISQRPAYQGYQAVYQLYRHVVLQEKVSERIQIPIHIYLKENLLPNESQELEGVDEAVLFM